MLGAAAEVHETAGSAVTSASAAERRRACRRPWPARPRAASPRTCRRTRSTGRAAAAARARRSARACGAARPRCAAHGTCDTSRGTQVACRRSFGARTHPGRRGTRRLPDLERRHAQLRQIVRHHRRARAGRANDRRRARERLDERSRDPPGRSAMTRVEGRLPAADLRLELDSQPAPTSNASASATASGRRGRRDRWRRAAPSHARDSTA